MPVRTCVGCRTARAQSDLVRFVRTGDGGVVPSRTAPGRGAWLCIGDRVVAPGVGVHPDCVATALQRNGFSRSFRVPVPRDAVASVLAGSGPTAI